jgi:hypothetical protein
MVVDMANSVVAISHIEIAKKRGTRSLRLGYRRRGEPHRRPQQHRQPAALRAIRATAWRWVSRRSPRTFGRRGGPGRRYFDSMETGRTSGFLNGRRYRGLLARREYKRGAAFLTAVKGSALARGARDSDPGREGIGQLRPKESKSASRWTRPRSPKSARFAKSRRALSDRMTNTKRRETAISPSPYFTERDPYCNLSRANFLAEPERRFICGSDSRHRSARCGRRAAGRHRFTWQDKVEIARQLDLPASARWVRYARLLRFGRDGARESVRLKTKTR